VLLVFVVARVIWRLGTPSPRLPETVPGVQRRLMTWTHASLYGLLLTMVVSGYVRTVGDRFPIELLDVLGVPALIPEHHEAAQLALIIHQIAAYGLVALVSVHAAAAVHDALIDRKGIFRRMWPPWADRDEPPREG
jgi:cytochrome b561